MAKTSARPQSRLLIIAAVGAALLVVGIVGPDMWRKYANTGKALRDARANLSAVIKARDAYLAEKNAEETVLKQARAAASTGDLWVTVNRAIEEVNLRERAKLNTVAERGSTTSARVQLDLTGVSLQELVDLLYKIYKGNSMAVVEQLTTLAASKDGKGLDCRMVLLAPKV